MKNIRYMTDGRAVEVDHEIDGFSFVRPFVEVVIFDPEYGEERDERSADYILKVPSSELYDAPPREKIDAEIKAKKDALAAFEAEARTRKSDAEQAAKKAEAKQHAAERDLARWFAENQQMIDLARMLNGEPMFPIHSGDNHYHRGPGVPEVPKFENVEYIALTPNRANESHPWNVKRRHSEYWDKPLRFFHSEEDRNAHISERFDVACERFRAKPDFSSASHTATTSLNWASLSLWVKRFPFLTIPNDIAEAKAADDERIKGERKAALMKEVEALEKDNAA